MSDIPNGKCKRHQYESTFLSVRGGTIRLEIRTCKVCGHELRISDGKSLVPAVGVASSPASIEPLPAPSITTIYHGTFSKSEDSKLKPAMRGEWIPAHEQLPPDEDWMVVDVRRRSLAALVGLREWRMWASDVKMHLDEVGWWRIPLIGKLVEIEGVGRGSVVDQTEQGVGIKLDGEDCRIVYVKQSDLIPQ